MASIEKMKEILNRQLKAFTQGDWKTYKACLTDNATYEEEATEARAQGGDAIVKAVEPWKRAFPDVDVKFKEVIGSGDALVAEIEWSGTQRGELTSPFGTVAPTGKPGKLPAVLVVRFDGERIRETRHYFDLLTMLRQMGVAPQMGAPKSA